MTVGLRLRSSVKLKLACVAWPRLLAALALLIAAFPVSWRPQIA